MRSSFRCPLAVLAIVFSFFAAGQNAGAQVGDPSYIHACAKLTSGNVRIVGPDSTCNSNERLLAWPREVVPTPPDPALLGRVEALESQVQSLQQEIEGLVAFITPPQISINDMEFTENCLSGAFATQTVSLNKPVQFVVSANYSTIDGSAISTTQNPDYMSNSGFIEFLPGETVKTVETQIYCDAGPENDEYFDVRLTNVINADVARSQGTVTLINDDLTVPLRLRRLTSVGFLNPGGSIAQEGQSLSFEVSAVAPSIFTMTVNYVVVGETFDETTDVAATDADDVYLAEGSLTFQPGVQYQTFVVDLVDDLAAEGIEGMIVMLSDPINATLHEQSFDALLVDDNDLIVQMSASVNSITEGTEVRTQYDPQMPSTASFTLQAQLSEPVAGPVIVQFRYLQSSAGWAIDGAEGGYGESYGYFGWGGDFSFVTDFFVVAPQIQSARIDPGETVAVQPVYLVSDGIAEGPETLNLEASVLGGAASTAPQFAIDILDDD